VPVGTAPPVCVLDPGTPVAGLRACARKSATPSGPKRRRCRSSSGRSARSRASHRAPCARSRPTRCAWDAQRDERAETPGSATVRAPVPPVRRGARARTVLGLVGEKAPGTGRKGRDCCSRSRRFRPFALRQPVAGRPSPRSARRFRPFALRQPVAGRPSPRSARRFRPFALRQPVAGRPLPPQPPIPPVRAAAAGRRQTQPLQRAPRARARACDGLAAQRTRRRIRRRA